MRQSGPQRRGRGRPSGRRGFNNSPNRSYDSSGPDIKVRGTASAVYDKYMALGRDAVLSGDRVAAENFFQHAEHYYRLMQATKQQQQQAGEGEQQRDNRGRGQQSRGGRGNDNAGAEGEGRKPSGEEGAPVEEAKVVAATESLDDDATLNVDTSSGTSTSTGTNAVQDAGAEVEPTSFVEEARVADGEEQRSAPMNPAELAAMSESGRKARGANGRGRGRQKKDNQDSDGADTAEAAPRRQSRRRRPAQAPEAAETPAPEADLEAAPEAVVVESETPAPSVAAVTEDAESN